MTGPLVCGIDLGQLPELIQQYQPRAYESPLESRLAWRLSKLLAPGVALTPQATVQTSIGRFRPDLLLVTSERRTALECDGREFHQDEHYDLVRDIAILKTGTVDQVLRFSGEDLYGSLPDLIQAIALLHPEAFNPRGSTLAARAAAPEMRMISPQTLIQQPRPLFGGTHPGRQFRYATLSRHALDAPLLATDSAQQVIAGLDSRAFRNIQHAVDATRPNYLRPPEGSHR